MFIFKNCTSSCNLVAILIILYLNTTIPYTVSNSHRNNHPSNHFIHRNVLFNPCVQPSSNFTTPSSPLHSFSQIGDITDSQDNVRVRFAPSPTGALHMGSVRTYIYNYLFARSRGGKVVLRMDDTDNTRLKLDSESDILSGLKWLGLIWDEGVGVSGNYGPYYQSQRNDIYALYAKKLIDEGKAYYCFCTREEIDFKRKKAIENGIPYKYDKQCRNLNYNTLHENLKNNKPYTIRIRSKEANDNDFILLRSNGTATYNFTSSVDDYLMRITHVIRGVEHWDNTLKQKQILEVIGCKVPEYVHCSLVLNPDKTKISKRDQNCITISELRNEGFSPLVIVNYLALLGTNYSNSRTIYDIDSLVKIFSLDLISGVPIVFDYDKLKWMNKMYISNMDTGNFLREFSKYIDFIGDIDLEINCRTLKIIAKHIVDQFKNQVHTYKEFISVIHRALSYVIPCFSSSNYKGSQKYDAQYLKVFDDFKTKTTDLINKCDDNEGLYSRFFEIIKEYEETASTRGSIRIIRYMMTGSESGPPFMDMVKMWKIAEEHEVENFTTLRERVKVLDDIRIEA